MMYSIILHFFMFLSSYLIHLLEMMYVVQLHANVQSSLAPHKVVHLVQVSGFYVQYSFSTVCLHYVFIFKFF